MGFWFSQFWRKTIIASWQKVGRISQVSNLLLTQMWILSYLTSALALFDGALLFQKKNCHLETILIPRKFLSMLSLLYFWIILPFRVSKSKSNSSFKDRVFETISHTYRSSFYVISQIIALPSHVTFSNPFEEKTGLYLLIQKLFIKCLQCVRHDMLLIIIIENNNNSCSQIVCLDRKWENEMRNILMKLLFIIFPFFIL